VEATVRTADVLTAFRRASRSSFWLLCADFYPALVAACIPWSTTASGLKWLFLNSSVSVQYNFPLDPSHRSDWLRAFNTTSNGIHGIYGFEGEPSGFADNTLVDTFLDDAVQTGSQSNASNVRGSWIDAARTDNGGQYGIYELASASSDQLSGYSTAPGYSPVFTTNSKWDPAANPLYFYDSTVCVPCLVSPSLSNPLSQSSPGAYKPKVLTTESWTDANLAQQANTYEPGSYKYYENSNTYHIQSLSYNASHYEASAAIVAHGPHSSLPFSFQLSDAQNFAITELNQHGGLPSDAVLRRVLIDYQHTNVGAVITGYTFFWYHQADIRGGDKIIVGVDNLSYKGQCTDRQWDGCVWTCDEWQTLYNQHVNFMYRLWRTVGADVPTPPTTRPYSTVATGTSAISPAQAYTTAMSKIDSSAQLKLGTFVGYKQSYWTPPYWATDDTAYPTFNFYFSSGAVVIADIGTGALRSVEDEN